MKAQMWRGAYGDISHTLKNWQRYWPNIFAMAVADQIPTTNTRTHSHREGGWWKEMALEVTFITKGANKPAYWAQKGL